MKQYYELLDPTINPPVVTYWHGDTTRASFLLELRGFVIPLGSKKPKKVSRETLYQF